MQSFAPFGSCHLRSSPVTLVFPGDFVCWTFTLFNFCRVLCAFASIFYLSSFSVFDLSGPLYKTWRMKNEWSLKMRQICVWKFKESKKGHQQQIFQRIKSSAWPLLTSCIDLFAGWAGDPCAKRLPQGPGFDSALCCAVQCPKNKNKRRKLFLCN